MPWECSFLQWEPKRSRRVRAALPDSAAEGAGCPLERRARSRQRGGSLACCAGGCENVAIAGWNFLHASAIVLLALHGLGLVTAVHAVMKTRTSQGALAWAFALITVPYFALPLYWRLGRDRFMGYVSARREEGERTAGSPVVARAGLARRRAAPPGRPRCLRRLQPPRAHALRGRQQRPAADRRQGGVRRPLRRDRRRDAVRAGAVLHRPRRRDRQGVPGGSSPGRARALPLRRDRLRRVAPPLPARIVRRRRRGAPLPHQPRPAEPLPDQLPQPSQDRRGRRARGLRRGPERGRRVPGPQRAVRRLARHARRHLRTGGQGSPALVRRRLALVHRPDAAARLVCRSGAARGQGGPGDAERPGRSPRHLHALLRPRHPVGQAPPLDDQS